MTNSKGFQSNRLVTRSHLLGVNIDHVATLRQQRGTPYPSLVHAALISEMNGADQITIHLREDRRHIQDNDVYDIKNQIQIPLNFEMALTDFMIGFALDVKPAICCIVPEKREERTTEGGLDVLGQFDKVKSATQKLMNEDLKVSLFIEADINQINAAFETGAKAIEIHTGSYADADSHSKREQEYKKIALAIDHAHQLGLIVNVGHGLSYHNVQQIAELPHIHEFNIGHAIVSKALFVGFAQAVREMKDLIS